jgi:hypothetical protein
MHVHLQRAHPDEKAGGVDQQTFPPSKGTPIFRLTNIVEERMEYHKLIKQASGD